MTTLSRDQADDPVALLTAALQLTRANDAGAAGTLAGAALTFGSAARVLLLRRDLEDWHIDVEAVEATGTVIRHRPTRGAEGEAVPMRARRAT